MSPRWAFHDGTFVDESAPAIHLTDRGLTFADGLFEILLVRRGVPLFFYEHVARMTASAAVFGMTMPFSPAALHAAAHRLIATNGIRSGEIYVSLSRGVDIHRDHRYPPDDRPPVFYMLAFPLRAIAPSNWTEGVCVYGYPDERHALCEHKTLNLLANVRAKNHAYAQGGYEAVMYRAAGGRRYVTEGGSSNYFCVRDGVLWTPSSENNLAGITREKILGLAGEMGMAVREERLWWDDLCRAAEVFLTSTVSRVMPVRRIDGRSVAAPGPVTARLAQAYERAIDRYIEEATEEATEETTE